MIVILLGDHAFCFDEIDALMKRHFQLYCIIENALLPAARARQQWERRRAQGRSGIIVTQAINAAETVLDPGARPDLKTSIAPGTYRLGHLDINTRLLHNTHSWAIVAIRETD